jgi:hypothetical protein
MDEFLVVLIVAFVIIGVLMVFGTPLAEWAGTAPGGGTSRTKEIASFSSIGRIGQSEGLVSRSSNFGSFVLGDANTDVLKTMPSLSVSSPALGSGEAKKFTIDVDSGILSGLKKLYIRFDVNDDPSKISACGNLRVLWNDMAVFEKVPKLFHYDLAVDPLHVKKSNVLEFETEAPPAWQVWCWNSVYTIDNMGVEVEYGPEKFFYFEIQPSEMEAWDKGVLSFYTTSGQKGELTILMNGREVYRKTNPSHMETVQFNYSRIANVMKIGENVLAFKSNAMFSIDDARFDVYLSTSDVVHEAEFQLTSDEVKLLEKGKGRIVFNVASVYKEGVLKVGINSNDLSLQTVRTGENSLDFGFSDVTEGRNMVKFSGTGSWDIADAEVSILY